ncbi:MAG: Trm112 family protein [Verrucomicrobia bacterium]|nr:Trm112 family protein [Verrucomicrobiota bacterium]
MIAADFLNLLCCPETHQALIEIDPALIESLNAGIAAGKIRNRAKQPVVTRIDGGLMREDRKYLYPVRGDIPVLLVDEAIPMDSLS